MLQVMVQPWEVWLWVAWPWATMLQVGDCLGVGGAEGECGPSTFKRFGQSFAGRVVIL